MKIRLSPLLFCLVFACGDEPAETGAGPARCRDYTDQAACTAEENALLDDGSMGRCAWHEGTVNDRSGDACTQGDSVGVCVGAGSTQMSCTYTAMNQTYPSCEGIFGEDDVPPFWIATNDGRTILVENLCGPTVNDDMAGRCGRPDDPPECECACL
jgi:hypothetical protein